jgi:hypothetical protein
MCPEISHFILWEFRIRKLLCRLKLWEFRIRKLLCEIKVSHFNLSEFKIRQLLCEIKVSHFNLWEFRKRQLLCILLVMFIYMKILQHVWVNNVKKNLKKKVFYFHWWKNLQNRYNIFYVNNILIQELSYPEFSFTF